MLYTLFLIFCYIIAITLTIYIIFRIFKTKTFIISDSIAILAIVLSSLIALDPFNRPASNINDAIRIEYNYTDSGAHYILMDFNESRSRKFYKINDHLRIPLNPLLSIDVVSLVDDEWIKIAPYFIVKIESIDTINYFMDYFGGDTGGSGFLEYFQGILSPEQNRIFAVPFFDNPDLKQFERSGLIYDNMDLGSTNDIDLADKYKTLGYFSLKPGERESFLLEFKLIPGYIFKFKIGVLFAYKGKKKTEWINKTFSAAYPKELKLWSASKKNGFRFANNWKMSDSVFVERKIELNLKMKNYNEIVKKENFFNFSQLRLIIEYEL